MRRAAIVLAAALALLLLGCDRTSPAPTTVEVATAVSTASAIPTVTTSPSGIMTPRISPTPTAPTTPRPIVPGASTPQAVSGTIMLGEPPSVPTIPGSVLGVYDVARERFLPIGPCILFSWDATACFGLLPAGTYSKSDLPSGQS